MRGFSIKLAVLTTVLSIGRADALVIDFDNLPEGKIVQSSDLPTDYTMSVNNRNTNHPDQGIIFDSNCPPGNVGTDCSGQDPDQITPGSGIGNNRAQNMTLIIAEDIVDTSPANGRVNDPDDEACGGTVTFTVPEGCELKSLRLIDIECNEEQTKIILQLLRQQTQSLPVVAIATRAQQRLCPRYRRLTERGKPPLAVATTIARELLGFIWAVGQLVEPLPAAARCA